MAAIVDKREWEAFALLVVNARTHESKYVANTQQHRPRHSIFNSRASSAVSGVDPSESLNTARTAADGATNGVGCSEIGLSWHDVTPAPVSANSEAAAMEMYLKRELTDDVLRAPDGVIEAVARKLHGCCPDVIVVDYRRAAF